MPKATNTTQYVNSGSPAGTTFNTAKVAAINFAPASSAASSTSIYNGDASDRVITTTFVSCKGAIGQGGSFQAATTTLANLGLGSNTNYIASSTATTTTLSSNFYIATSTGGPPTYMVQIWPAATYVTFVAVGTSYTGLQLSTCTAGVNYLAS